MAVWSRGGLSGFDMTPVQLAGRFVGRKPGKWLFWDGTCGLWLPKEHVSYRRVGGGAIVVTIPQWLAKKAKRVPLRFDGKGRKVPVKPKVSIQSSGQTKVKTSVFDDSFEQQLADWKYWLTH